MAIVLRFHDRRPWRNLAAILRAWVRRSPLRPARVRVRAGRGGARAPRRGSGFTLVETMIAVGLLLIITLGVLPLFTQSAVNNASGADYLQANNHIRGRLEEFSQLPFDSALLTPTGTAPLVQEWDEGDVEKEGDERWVAAGSAGQMIWTRSTRVRQFSVNALDDGRVTASEELGVGADPVFVHLKEIQVTVSSSRTDGGLFGPSKQVTITKIKAF